MTTRSTKARRLPPPRRCGSYHAGHQVHPVQFFASVREGPGEPCTVTSVADDGTITFADGSTLWNHEPERLRVALAAAGNQALRAPRSILKVKSEEGWYCFSVWKEPDPCDERSSAVIPGESIVDEMIRRGGILVDPRDVDPETLVRRPEPGKRRRGAN